MGFIFSKAMDSSFKKQQEFQLETMRLQIDRQMNMQNLMREKAMAMQISGARTNLLYSGSFGVLAAIGCIAGFKKTQNRAVLAPLLPISFVVAYNIDLAYGNMIHRIRNGAEQILCDESELLGMPGGMITVNDVDTRRQRNTEDTRFKPNDVFL